VSRKRGKKHKAAVEAIPDDILAEGSGPVDRAASDAISTVEDVVTTDDIATTEDVVTADDVVATAVQSRGSAEPDAPGRDDAAAELGLAPDAHLGVPSMNDEGYPAASAPDEASLDAAGVGDAAGADVTGLEDPDEAGEVGEAGEAAEAGDGDEDDAAIVFPTSAASMDAIQVKHLVEALIFAADRPLTIQRLRQLTRVGDVRRLEQALAEIAEDYRERGVVLQQVSGGYQFRTRTQFSAWVQQLIAGRPVRLSRAQLETLAIIAYRQPITRPEIDDIRGVDSSATLKLLIDRMLIRVLGKREEVGRPMLYGTTKEFLDFFSLGDLRELPTLREYSELTAESRKVMSDRLGIAPDGGGEGDGSGGSGDGGGGEGGDGGGDSSPGGGGDGGGGPMPGGGGIVSDDGAPASATASDLADAVASFLSAADAVDRSNAAAMADPDDEHHESADAESAGDELAGDELAGAGSAGDELAGDELASDVITAQEPGAMAEQALEEAGHALAADLSLAHDEPADRVPGDGDVGEAAVGSFAEADDGADGQVVGDAGWPDGSRRFAAVASSDERPVEPPAMDSHVIGAGALDDSHGDAVTAAAVSTSHVEPAAE
jgi:segregation and condensation protein B